LHDHADVPEREGGGGKQGRKDQPPGFAVPCHIPAEEQHGEKQRGRRDHQRFDDVVGAVSENPEPYEPRKGNSGEQEERLVYAPRTADAASCESEDEFDESDRGRIVDRNGEEPVDGDGNNGRIIEAEGGCPAAQRRKKDSEPQVFAPPLLREIEAEGSDSGQEKRKIDTEAGKNAHQACVVVRALLRGDDGRGSKRDGMESGGAIEEALGDVHPESEVHDGCRASKRKATVAGIGHQQRRSERRAGHPLAVHEKLVGSVPAIDQQRQRERGLLWQSDGDAEPAPALRGCGSAIEALGCPDAVVEVRIGPRRVIAFMDAPALGEIEGAGRELPSVKRRGTALGSGGERGEKGKQHRCEPTHGAPRRGRR